MYCGELTTVYAVQADCGEVVSVVWGADHSLRCAGRLW